MPSAGAIHSGNKDQGKIKLRDNDDDKNNMCAVKDQQHHHHHHHRQNNRNLPVTPNVPQQQSPEVKVKCGVKSRDCVVYLSLAGIILILCSSALFIGLWYGRMYGAEGDGEAEAAAVFRRHLTSDYSVEEIRRITRGVIQEELELPSRFEDGRLRSGNLYPEMASNEEDQEEEEDAETVIRNERKRMRPKRSSNHVLGGQQQAVADQPSGPVVEFFNPKIRHELEKKDADFLKRTGLKGAAPGGDAWVWLTSYSRIPAEAITGFCRATKEYCPAGPPGHPGIPGPKGNRGDIGMPGPPGIDGKEGALGPRGPPGQRGLPGGTGLDGRDGVPGEPGLDGVPGRAGSDGTHGRDGKHGEKGEPGQNGKDGIPGTNGPIGPPGIPGERGLSGPRGRSGKPGTNGVPGIPGITGYQYRVNGTKSSDLLIPPSIVGMNENDFLRPIVVQEGENLRLRCAATGTPRPEILWRRLDNRPISYGKWEDSAMVGHTMNITNIQRTHMGVYQCCADNGIPPAANATFNVEVQFEPLIRVRHQNMTAANGTSVVLECEVEAYPDPVRYWERESDGRLLDTGLRYQIDTEADGGYKSKMRLTMTIMSSKDYGAYHCVSKNELNTTRGVFFINPPTPYIQPLPIENRVAVFGKQPPPKLSLEDLCPPPVQCRDCPDPKEKCKDTVVSLHDLIGGKLEITPTGRTTRYAGLPNRTMDAVLYAVGKPVFHKAVPDKSYGAWMKDPFPANNEQAEKIWVTREDVDDNLYEYANKEDFRKNSMPRLLRLNPKLQGSASTVFNGSFYYQEAGRARVIRYPLGQERKTHLDLSYAVATGPRHLYKVDYNYIDFNVDENGLWVIHGVADSNNTIVSKLGINPGNGQMTIQYSWNITLNHQKVGEMFIVCGVLYAIDSNTERNTKIRFALDLYNIKLLDSALTFTNPFRNTTSVSYNAKTKELFTWDAGNQLTYPIRYNSIGNEGASSERGENDMQSNDQVTDFTIEGRGVF